MKQKINKLFKIKYLYTGLICIGIIIISVIFIITYFNNTTENYSNISLPINFLSKYETQKFISDDSDDYIKNLTIYDLRARKVNSNNEYIDLITDNCINFSEEEKDKLGFCAKQAKSFFDNGFTWTFALIKDIYEEGFPHTRSNIIFLAPNILKYNNEELIKTLIHESVHIYQRYNSDKMAEYIKNNGYSIFKKKEKKSLIRSNPDLDEYIYKDKNGIEMVAKYKSEYPIGINDTLLSNSSNEHPFEKMAYEIAENYYKSVLTKYKDI